MKQNLFNFILNKNKNTKTILNNNLKTVSLNFGPQHPAAHGVLRLVLKLNNELIEDSDSHIGLLHRGTEKLIENKIFIHALPYFDRLDYVSTLLQEHAYCIAVDKLFKKKNYSSGIIITRTVLDELTRVLNHLLAISCHALDVGSMSPIFWAFEEREKIMEFYERVSGARMHTAFYKPVIKSRVLDNNLSNDILDFIVNSVTTMNEMHNILSLNKIWKVRLKGIGLYDYKTALDYSLTGVMARSTGLKRDLRLNKYTTYNNYYYLNFYSYTSRNGDSYDRFMLRMYEMLESFNIINQSLTQIDDDFSTIHNINSNLINECNSMEDLIEHFKFWSTGIFLEKNQISQFVESPKGEFGVTLLTNDSNKPYRCKIRSASLIHLQLLKQLIKNTFLSDLVTLIGTIDIVFGEVDR